MQSSKIGWQQKSRDIHQCQLIRKEGRILELPHFCWWRKRMERRTRQGKPFSALKLETRLLLLLILAVHGLLPSLESIL